MKSIFQAIATFLTALFVHLTAKSTPIASDTKSTQKSPVATAQAPVSPALCAVDHVGFDGQKNDVNEVPIENFDDIYSNVDSNGCIFCNAETKFGPVLKVPSLSKAKSMGYGYCSMSGIKLLKVEVCDPCEEMIVCSKDWSLKDLFNTIISGYKSTMTDTNIVNNYIRNSIMLSEKDCEGVFGYNEKEGTFKTIKSDDSAFDIKSKIKLIKENFTKAKNSNLAYL